MKKILYVLLMVASLTSVAGCLSEETPNKDNLLKIAFIGREDITQDQNLWKGIKAWGDTNGLKNISEENVENTYQFIRITDYGYLVDAVNEANITNTDIVILSPNFFSHNESNFEFLSQVYPSTTFIVFENYLFRNWNNFINIDYKHEEAAFLAGYGAVADGHMELGFGGYLYHDFFVNNGIGFIAGIAYANKALAKNASLTLEHYSYSNANSSWYTESLNPIDLIFSEFGMGNGFYLHNEAKEFGKWMIGMGYDVGLSTEMTRVLTSTIRQYGPSIQNILDRIVEGNNVKDDLDGLGGTIERMGADKNAIGLPTGVTIDGVEQSTWRFTNWSIAEYNELYNKIKTGQIVVPSAGEENKNQLRDFIAQHGTLEGFDETFLNYVYTGTKPTTTS